MKEAYGDIWKLGKRADAIVITTNGSVRKDGKAVMGTGLVRLYASRNGQSCTPVFI
jgi:hypothetical protein